MLKIHCSDVLSNDYRKRGKFSIVLRRKKLKANCHLWGFTHSQNWCCSNVITLSILEKIAFHEKLDEM